MEQKNLDCYTVKLYNKHRVLVTLRNGIVYQIVAISYGWRRSFFFFAKGSCGVTSFLTKANRNGNITAKQQIA